MWITLICAGALFFFEWVLVRVFATMGQQMMDQVLNMGFVKTILEAMLGTEIREFSIQILRAFGWIHPVVLALTWTHVVAICSRLPAGETTHGSADFLLTMPVTRRGLFVSVQITWFASVIVLLSAGLMGHVVGIAGLENASEIAWDATLMVLLNLLLLLVSVASLTSLSATLFRRRGRAIGFTMALVLVSFFWNFVAQFWEPAKSTAFLSFLTYYQPMEIIRLGRMPWLDLSILTAISSVLWAAAYWRFRRMDILTT